MMGGDGGSASHSVPSIPGPFTPSAQALLASLASLAQHRALTALNLSRAPSFGFAADLPPDNWTLSATLAPLADVLRTLDVCRTLSEADEAALEAPPFACDVRTHGHNLAAAARAAAAAVVQHDLLPADESHGATHAVRCDWNTLRSLLRHVVAEEMCRPDSLSANGSDSLSAVALLGSCIGVVVHFDTRGVCADAPDWDVEDGIYFREAAEIPVCMHLEKNAVFYSLYHRSLFIQDGDIVVALLQREDCGDNTAEWRLSAPLQHHGCRYHAPDQEHEEDLTEGLWEAVQQGHFRSACIDDVLGDVAHRAFAQMDRDVGFVKLYALAVPPRAAATRRTTLRTPRRCCRRTSSWRAAPRRTRRAARRCSRGRAMRRRARCPRNRTTRISTTG
jgi:hypothetical protein